MFSDLLLNRCFLQRIGYEPGNKSLACCTGKKVCGFKPLLMAYPLVQKQCTKSYPLLLMSTTTLRYRMITLSFLPYKRDQRLSKSLRTLRIRTSRRRAKKTMRQMLTHVKSYA